MWGRFTPRSRSRFSAIQSCPVRFGTARILSCTNTVANDCSLRHSVKPFWLETKAVRSQVVLLRQHTANATIAKNGPRLAIPTSLTPPPCVHTTIGTFTMVTGRYARSTALRIFNQLLGSTQPDHYYATCAGIHDSSTVKLQSAHGSSGGRFIVLPYCVERPMRPRFDVSTK